MAEEEKKDTINNEAEDAAESKSSDDEVVEISDEEEKVEIVDEKYRPKIKPVLDPAAKDQFERKKARKLPDFKRQEWFRYKRLGDHWRKPRGLHSKMRVNKGYRPPRVRVGFRTPTGVRGLHPSGFREVLIYNTADLDKINPEKEAVRIGKSVGMRKRIDIIDKADGMSIRVLNRRGL